MQSNDTGVNQDREEAAGKIRKEEMLTGVDDEGDIKTEERKERCAGATLRQPTQTRRTLRAL